MKASYALGLFYIISVAIIWSAASILVQFLYQNLEFDSPFLLTYIGTSLLIVLIPIYVIHSNRYIHTIGQFMYEVITCKRIVFLILPCNGSSSNSSCAVSSSGNANNGHNHNNNKIMNKGHHSIRHGTDKASPASLLTEEGNPLSLYIEEDNFDDNHNSTITTTTCSAIDDTNYYDDHYNNDHHHSSSTLLSTTTTIPPINNGINHYEINNNSTTSILSHLDHLKLAMKVAPFWFISNYFYNVSLQYTTIT